MDLDGLASFNRATCVCMTQYVALETKITFPFFTFDFLHYLSSTVTDPSQMMVHFIEDGSSYMTLFNSSSHQSDTKL